MTDPVAVEERGNPAGQITRAIVENLYHRYPLTRAEINILVEQSRRKDGKIAELEAMLAEHHAQRPGSARCAPCFRATAKFDTPEGAVARWHLDRVKRKLGGPKDVPEGWCGKVGKHAPHVFPSGESTLPVWCPGWRPWGRNR